MTAASPAAAALSSAPQSELCRWRSRCVAHRLAGSAILTSPSAPGRSEDPEDRVEADRGDRPAGGMPKGIAGHHGIRLMALMARKEEKKPHGPGGCGDRAQLRSQRIEPGRMRSGGGSALEPCERTLETGADHQEAAGQRGADSPRRRRSSPELASASPAREEDPIADYDDPRVAEIKSRLPKLSEVDCDNVESYERTHKSASPSSKRSRDFATRDLCRRRAGHERAIRTTSRKKTRADWRRRWSRSVAPGCGARLDLEDDSLGHVVILCSRHVGDSSTRLYGAPAREALRGTARPLG